MEKKINIEELNEQIEQQEEKMDRAREVVKACDKKVEEFEQKLKDFNAQEIIKDNTKMLDYVIASDAIITVLQYKRAILGQYHEETQKLNAMYDELWLACEVF